MFSLDIFDEILRLNIGVSQSDNARMFELLSGIHPLRLHRYTSGREHNGWMVPHDWVVHRAEIRRDGKVLFDGTRHPMAVAGYSPSFEGKVLKDELDRHVFVKKELPDVYPFHCMNNYRPWARDWGFCVPFNVWKAWPAGEYEVALETEYRDGEMLVGEIHHDGECSDTVVFNAHTCHPCQFNDDLAGVAVILELFKWLRGRKTRWSYRAVLAPEHLGTVFYLADLPEAERRRLKMGAFVEMVGIDEDLILQQSFDGKSILDRVMTHALRRRNPGARVGAFRTVVGNDETVWEAAGIEIPFVSLSRCVKNTYYPQYHTNEDDLRITSEAKLREALEVLQETVEILESDRYVHRKFTGLVALSNPRYNLYVERPDPTVAKNLSERDLNLGRLQDRLPRYFDGSRTVFDIAERNDIDFATLRDYVGKFQDRGLVKLLPPDTLDAYKSTGGIVP